MMMTQDAGNIRLRRLLGVKSELAYWIRKEKDWFVADAAVTYGINDIYQRV
jgi:hypothetical protein